MATHSRARLLTEIPSPSRRLVHGKAVGNVLLRQMPEEEFLTIRPHLQLVKLNLADRLEQEGNPIASVYFLNGGIASMIIETGDGRSVEVGIAGREDMVGLPLAGGLSEFTYSVVVQSPSDGFRVAADTMKRLLPSMPGFSRMLLRRLAIRNVELAQNAACNRLHPIGQRLARWLLVTHDRINSDVIIITHEFLSKMVGTDRATVTIKLEELEKDKIIQRSRGSIAILNRTQLEHRSCECYRVFSQFNVELGLTA